jgi:hypothetical protein
MVRSYPGGITRFNVACPMAKTEKGKLKSSGMHLCDEPEFSCLTKTDHVNPYIKRLAGIKLESKLPIGNHRHKDKVYPF